LCRITSDFGRFSVSLRLPWGLFEWHVNQVTMLLLDYQLYNFRKHRRIKSFRIIFLDCRLNPISQLTPCMTYKLTSSSTFAEKYDCNVSTKELRKNSSTPCYYAMCNKINRQRCWKWFHTFSPNSICSNEKYRRYMWWLKIDYLED